MDEETKFFMKRRKDEVEKALRKHLCDLEEIENRSRSPNLTIKERHAHLISAEYIRNEMNKSSTELAGIEETLKSQEVEKSGFDVDFKTSGMIEIFGSRLYSSPLVFVRENIQNAIDATRLRVAKTNMLPSELRIDLEITESCFSVRDRGIGMTRKDLREYYWSVGSTSKNTDEARNARCIGEFGIGGFANFGLSSTVEVTSSIDAQPGIVTWITRDDLDKDSRKINIGTDENFTGPGTRVRCLSLTKSFPVADMIEYATECSQYLPENLYINGQPVERRAKDAVILENSADTLVLNFGRGLMAGVVSGRFIESNSRVWFAVSQIIFGTESYHVSGAVEISRDPLVIFKHDFLITEVDFRGRRLGGNLDLPFLRPTASRQGLEQTSQRKLQSLHDAITRALLKFVAQSPALMASYWAEGFRDFVAEDEKNIDFLKHYELPILGEEAIPLSALVASGGEAYIYKGGSKIHRPEVASDVPIIDLSSFDARIRKLIESHLRTHLKIRDRPEFETTLIVSEDSLDIDARMAIAAMTRWLEIYGLDHISVRLLSVQPINRMTARFVGDYFEVNTASLPFQLLASEIGKSFRDDRKIAVAGSFVMDHSGSVIGKLRKKVFGENGSGIAEIEKYLPPKLIGERAIVAEVAEHAVGVGHVSEVADSDPDHCWAGEGHSRVLVKPLNSGEMKYMLRIPSELNLSQNVVTSSECKLVAFADRLYLLFIQTERMVCVRVRAADRHTNISPEHPAPIISQIRVNVMKFGTFIEIPKSIFLPNETRWAIVYDTDQGGSLEADLDSLSCRISEDLGSLL